MNNGNKEIKYAPQPFDAYKGKDKFIFVSYSHLDRNTVYHDLLNIYNMGYKIWYDAGIPPGNSNYKELALSIQKCSLLLFFASSNSIKSDHVIREIDYAVNKNVKIIPIYLEEIKHPIPEVLDFQLRGTQTLKRYLLIEKEYLKKIDEILSVELPFEKRIIKSTNTPNALDIQQKHNPGENSLSTMDDIEEDIQYKYDVFLTFRNLDNDLSPTFDSALAGQIYTYLKNRKLKIFHKVESIKELSKENAKIAIDDALRCSRNMIVVAMKPENIKFKKLAADWEIFEKLLKKRKNPDGLLITYIKGFSKNELPEKLLNYQLIIEDNGGDEKKRKAFNEVYELISSVFAKTNNDFFVDFDKIGMDKLESVLISNNKFFYLRRISEIGTPREIKIFPGDTIKIGRTTENQIVIDNERVSRRHARIVYKEKGIFIQDLRSKNGTYIFKDKLKLPRPVRLPQLKVVRLNLEDKIYFFNVGCYKLCKSKWDTL